MNISNTTEEMDNTRQIPDDIRQFLENLLQEAGMLSLDDKTHEEMIQELFYQLDNYLASITVKYLEPQDLDTFVRMNEEKKSKEEIQKFITEKIPHSERVFMNAFKEFQNLYLDNVSEARDKQTITK